MINQIKSALIIGLIVAAGMFAFYWAPSDSLVQSILLIPLFPGLVAGLIFGTSGRIHLTLNVPVEVLSGLIVNTGLYWGLWTILSLVIRPLRRRKKQ